MKKPLAAVFLSLALLAPAAAQGQTASRSFQAQYTVIARGIEAGVFDVSYTESGGAYRINAERRMTGMIGAMLRRSQDYTYTVTGRVAENGALRAGVYQHTGGRRREDRPNGRTIRAVFTPDNVVTTANPPGGSMGHPPATPEQKRGVLDQLSAIASLVTASEDPCSETLHVYMDGRARFDFVLSPAGRVNVNTRAYHGEAIRCSVAFRPIAGFSDPQEAATLTFLFAPTPSGMFAPVQIEMPADDVGMVRLQARSLRVNGADVS